MLFTAALWRGALPAVQSKELLMEQFFLTVFLKIHFLGILEFRQIQPEDLHQ